jgi:hypothetical protein
MRGGKKPQPRVDAYLFAKTWKMFGDGRQLSAHDLVEILEISKRTAWLWLRTLHEMRCVHIVGWHKDTIGRDQTPIYAEGDGFDKPKSKRTPEDRRRKYHERKARLLEKKVCGSF